MNQTDWPILPRIPLGHFPTALEPLDRLSAQLGGPRIWIKRDDCTGLAGGGNKTRKLELLAAEAMGRGATHLLTSGGVQSNHARQTAAVAARLGLRGVLMLEDSVPGRKAGYYTTGNILGSRLFGAEVHLHPKGTDLASAMQNHAQALTRGGAVPYIIPAGGSSGIGSLAYALALGEFLDQCRALPVSIGAIFVATGSGGTHAGLLAGAAQAGVAVAIHGVCVGKPRDHVRSRLHEIETELQRAGLPQGFGACPVVLDDSQIGPGYGQPTPAALEAIRLFATCEGILLDPVYTGKAAAGLIASLRSGDLAGSSDILFWHTGGAMALSAYAADIASISVPVWHG